MRNESGDLFENSENADLLREAFLTRKFLTNCENTFYDSINEEVEQLFVQAGDEPH